ncbi:MAG: EF-P beta-lysylation protein EpmB [Gammaproteobacteria bacterium]|nr:EF-P beta-lysylation protein EpmB [Gammaproteobacteria bacterium]MDH5778846.1 EF-P beta-lysylation protein EpmB [Gammaproteobacteria bacterium]
MIPRTATTWQTENWQKELASAIRDPRELLQELDLPMSLLAGAQQAGEQFPLRVTASYLSRIEKANPDDPLLRQILPLAVELDTSDGYRLDPVGDLSASPVPGLLHKYHGRVLLVTTGACAIHCRYCFRRHYPYAEGCANSTQLDQIIEYIQSDITITEVILSGGDPLTLSNSRLAELFKRLNSISHLKRIRLHTRLPIVLPSRIDQGLLALFSEQARQIVLVVHCNHPNEIDSQVSKCLVQLDQIGVSLLNQSVLLSGVNDNIVSLTELSERLFAAKTIPYYLHLLDRVQGAEHFEVERDKATDLIQQLRNLLPGYLVPTLVEEKEGAPAKLPLTTNSL